MLRMPDGFVDMVVTSPPYYGLRDYGHSDQIGLEETPEQFIQALVNVFAEVRRVLSPTGTLWLNMGDTYNAYKANTGDTSFAGFSGRPEHKRGLTTTALKNKDLIGIPWMLAFALRAEGWYLRQDIIWHKPNPMPESVTDRCTKAHEYIFLLSKSARYYYDIEAIKEPLASSSIARLSQDIDNQEGSKRVPGKTNGAMKAVSSGNKERKPRPNSPENNSGNQAGSIPWVGVSRNKRSVWTVTTKPYSEAHFATFPPDLIIPCIQSGSRVNGLVYDPFGGSGTTAEVCERLNRKWILSELNAEYCAIAEKRLLPYKQQTKLFV